MIIENRKLLNSLYGFLEFHYKDKENFRGFCNLISDCKKCGISFDELVIAIENSWQSAEEMEGDIELSITSENNRCYKYRVPRELYDNLCDSVSHYFTIHVIVKDFLHKDYTESRDFYQFISDEYETISHRTMDKEEDCVGESISFFKNIKRNKRIKKFCRIIDSLNGNEINMFEIFDRYRSVYKGIWGFGKYRVQEMIVYDTVISFFRYPETKRKQVSFFDFLIADITKRYVIGYKQWDVSEMFPHEDLLPCPFCGRIPHIYMTTSWFDLIVMIKCGDCLHIMSKYVIESSGFNQRDSLCIHSFQEVIHVLVEKWNHRIKNDDMWMDDDTLPEELPECNPDMLPKIIYAPGLKCCPFCGNKAGFIKTNSKMGRDGKRNPEGIKTIKVVCGRGCFAASHFGTPEKIPDKHTIRYMAYRWNQRNQDTNMVDNKTIESRQFA